MPPPPPAWVQKLKPAEPQGSTLLEGERAKSNIDVQNVTKWLFDEDELESKHAILKILQADPVFDKSQNYFAGRLDRFKMSLARAKRLRQLAAEHEWSLEEHNTATDLLAEPMPYQLHGTMFLLTLFNQGNEEQRKKYFYPAMDYNIIGCYAQTELGHGSNVRGLETTSTWNPEDKTFTINSPSLTSSKWWIGSLGRTANHAVVMAQLWVGGKCYGPHTFVVQVRDMKTHKPLEGVYVGDVGPKVGYNTMDNGFLLFNKVKIPHGGMLARHSRVDPNTNQYVPPPSSSLVFGTMTFVRARLVWQSGGYLARGVTVALRYCSVRRQFKDQDSPDQKGETQVLDYTMVSYRLLPLLAASYALHFSGKLVVDMYEEGQAKLNEDPSSEEAQEMLADLHATSCGLKSLSTTITAEGLEQARRACGGHGYSAFSGIGQLYADYLPNITWEGDNYMLTQQVARYLIKAARTVLEGTAKLNSTTSILQAYRARQTSGAGTFDILKSDDEIVAAFAHRAAHYTFEATHQRDELNRPWNDLLVDFYHLSKAHSQYLVVKNFYDALGSDATKETLDQTSLPIVHALFRLFALHTLDGEAREFFSSGAADAQQIRAVRHEVLALLKLIRPHAVKLVDAWDFSDFQLDSSLGRYDGKVYEDMFYRASQKNPLNDITVDPYPTSNVLFKNPLTLAKL